MPATPVQASAQPATPAAAPPTPAPPPAPELMAGPGAGRFSTDRWPAGFVMRDVYHVAWPEWAGPGRYRVEVQVYAFPDEMPVGTVTLPAFSRP